MFLTRAEEPLPAGPLDYAHYKAIHHHLFQDVYEWAGRPREIRTSKDGNWFCYPEYIDAEMMKLFAELSTEQFLKHNVDAKTFATRAAHYIAEINAIHPFREGNGRCQLSFLHLLCIVASFQMNEDVIQPARFIKAMIASFHGDNDLLTQEIIELIS